MKGSEGGCWGVAGEHFEMVKRCTDSLELFCQKNMVKEETKTSNEHRRTK